MLFRDTNEAMIYKAMLAKADELKLVHQKAQTETAWSEFQEAEIACADYAAAKEGSIWED